MFAIGSPQKSHVSVRRKQVDCFILVTLMNSYSNRYRDEFHLFQVHNAVKSVLDCSLFFKCSYSSINSISCDTASSSKFLVGACSCAQILYYFSIDSSRVIIQSFPNMLSAFYSNKMLLLEVPTTADFPLTSLN